MRTPIIAGNWKMNKTLKEARDFGHQLQTQLSNDLEIEAVVIPPDLYIETLLKLTEGTDVGIGAQNASHEDFGAFTGETSPAALSQMGVDYVVLGHSERRQFFHETNEEINQKVHAVLKNHMSPIICVGESLEEKEAGQTEEIITEQVVAALKEVQAEDIPHVVFAYEPIWAIGTGKTADGKEANQTAQTIRNQIAELYTKDLAEKVRIQYGGSVKPENITEFLSQSDIDGALVGGASLEVESFLDMLEAVMND